MGTTTEVPTIEIPPKEVRIVLDRDCPGCGHPEVVAIGASVSAGPNRVECARRVPCGYLGQVKRS